MIEIKEATSRLGVLREKIQELWDMYKDFEKLRELCEVLKTHLDTLRRQFTKDLADLSRNAGGLHGKNRSILEYLEMLLGYVIPG